MSQQNAAADVVVNSKEDVNKRANDADVKRVESNGEKKVDEPTTVKHVEAKIGSEAGRLKLILCVNIC